MKFQVNLIIQYQYFIIISIGNQIEWEPLIMNIISFQLNYEEW